MKLFESLKRAFFCAALLACVAAQGAEGDLLNVRETQDSCIPIVFDTDIGGDIDDAFALALIHRFCDEGVCELLGVTLTNSHPSTAQYVAAQNALYGRPDVPVALPKKAGRHTDRYPSAICARKTSDGAFEYPVPEGFKPEEPVALLRRLLASARDNSVVIVQVGFSTNLANLLDSPGDEISPLSGKELAAKKVRLVSVMGAAFAVDPTAESYRKHCEWNIVNDVPSAQKFVAEWPTEIVFSGYEVGDRIRMSPTNLKRDYRSPRAKFLRDSFENWAKAAAPKEMFDHRRPTWDLTSVLFVLRPEEGRGYFELSEPGEVAFDDKGGCTFTPTPEGKRRAFICDENARIRVSEAFVNLCSEP